MTICNEIAIIKSVMEKFTDIRDYEESALEIIQTILFGNQLNIKNLPTETRRLLSDNVRYIYDYSLRSNELNTETRNKLIYFLTIINNKFKLCEIPTIF